jgi:pimeloyl-ACP methyl ester carboxylesterase
LPCYGESGFSTIVPVKFDDRASDVHRLRAKGSTKTARNTSGKGLMVARFLLVHGGWEAGWVWRTVEDHLRAEGHEVFRPTLTGLGERSHLLTPAVDLETHITDILNLIKWEKLRNVTLVGHSYGGMVVTGVADRVHDRVGSLIYLDAFIPKEGRSLLDLLPSERAAITLKLAQENGDGWRVPVAVPEAGPIQHVREGKYRCPAQRAMRSAAARELLAEAKPFRQSFEDREEGFCLRQRIHAEHIRPI